MQTKIVSFIVLFVVLLITGCHTTMVDPKVLTLDAPRDLDGFILQPAGISSPIATFYDSTGKQQTKPWAALSNEQIQKILSDTHATISVGKFTGSGGITYLAASATASAGTYKVTMDYCEFVTETVTDPTTKETIGLGRVGVGLRLTAIVTTKKADINLGSLMALGVAASTGYLSGTMTVDSIGIRIAGNAGPILSNTTIDESSIQKTLESIAVIQSKIADSSTHLDPQILAIKPATPKVDPAKVVHALR